MTTLLKLSSTCLALLFCTVLFSQQFTPLIATEADPVGISHGPNDDVYGFLTLDDQLWFYGAFDEVNGVSMPCVAFKNQFGFTQPGAFSFPEEVEAITHLEPFLDGAAGIAKVGQHEQLLFYQNGSWELSEIQFDGGGVEDLEVLGDRVFIGGEFEEMNGIWQPYWCEYHPEFGVNWNNSLVNAPIRCLKVSAGQLYIGGDFMELEGEASVHVALLNNSGWFRFPDGLDGPVKSFETFNGNLYLSGDFNSIYGEELNLLGICELDGDAFVEVQNNYPNWSNSRVSKMNAAGGKLFLSVNQPFEETVVIEDGVWTHFSDFELSHIKKYNGEFYACLPKGNYNGAFSETSVFKVNMAAQSFAQLKTDAMEYQFSAQGMFLRKKDSFGASPIGLSDDLAGAEMIQEAAFCYSGIQNDAIVAAGSGGLDDQEAEDVKWAFGPFAGYYNQEYFDHYSRVWRVSIEEIETHIAQIGQPGYVIPEAIFSYPGNGNSDNGEAEILAPFHDTNNNQIYEPWLGEFPEIRGDDCVTWLLHENDFSAQRAGVQLVQQAYVMNTTGEAKFENSLFIHTEMRNTSSYDLEDLSIGMYSDFDIGSLDANDSFYGCVEDKNCFYAYRDPEPNSSFVNAFDFEEYHPAVACVFLNQELSSFLAVHEESALFGGPKNAGEVHHLLNSRWGYGASYGIGPCINFIPYQFMWPSYPWDTSDEARTPFTQGIPNGYRSGIGGCNAQELPSGGSLCIDVAFVAANPASTLPFSEVGVLIDRIDEVQDWYNTTQLGCTPNEVLVNTEESGSNSGMLLYPNPSRGYINLQVAESQQNSSYLIYTSMGEQVLSGQLKSANTRLNLEELSSGMYFIKVGSSGSIPFLVQ